MAVLASLYGQHMAGFGALPSEAFASCANNEP